MIDAIKMYDPELVLVALAGSNLVEQARAAGLKVVSEAFADRAYNSDGSLSRRLEGAFYDSGFVASRVVSMLKMVGSSQLMVYLPQFRLTRFAYGDTDGALEMSAAIKAELVKIILKFAHL